MVTGSRIAIATSAAVVAGSLSFAQTLRNRRPSDQAKATGITSAAYFALAGAGELGARALASGTGMNVWAARGAVVAGAAGAGLLTASLGDGVTSDIAAGVGLGAATALAAGAGGVGAMQLARHFGASPAVSWAAFGAIAVGGAVALAHVTGDRGFPEEGDPVSRLKAGLLTGAAMVGGLAAVSAGGARLAPIAQAHPIAAAVGAGALVTAAGVGGYLGIGKLLDSGRTRPVPDKYLPQLEQQLAEKRDRFSSASPSAPTDTSLKEIPAEAGEYIMFRTARDRIANYWPQGTPTFEPVRSYTPMKPRETLEQRADRAVAEFDRLGGFYRHTILLNIPTGTGAPIANASGIAEIAYRGDVASIGVQYTDLPAPYSIPDIDDGVKLQTLVLERLNDRIATMSPESRPKIVATGYSLGAGVLWNLTGGGDPEKMDALGIDRAVLYGTPAVADARWREHAIDSPDVRLRGVGQQDDRDLDARTTVVSNVDDPVGTTGGQLLVSGGTRDGSSDHSLFLPVATFFQHLLDASATQGEVGVLTNGFGHSYNDEMADTLPTAFGSPMADWQVEAIQARAREIELQRQEALAGHKPPA